MIVRLATRQPLDVPDLSQVESVRLTNVATGERMDLVADRRDIAVAFIDPRCDVCARKAAQVIEAVKAMGKDEIAVAVLTSLSDLVKAMEGFEYPANLLFTTDSASLRELDIRYVPIFVAFDDGRPNVHFKGLPSRSKIWLHKLLKAPDRPASHGG